MAKITQVTIISPTTLRLDVDAKMGDEIDLLDISKIDNMLIQEIINKEKEKEIKKLLEENKQDKIKKYSYCFSWQSWDIWKEKIY